MLYAKGADGAETAACEKAETGERLSRHKSFERIYGEKQISYWVGFFPTQYAVLFTKRNIQMVSLEITHAVLDSSKAACVAMAVAALWHEGQMRRNREHYICHSIRVAARVMDMGVETNGIVAALLHDVLEKTGCTVDDLIAEGVAPQAIDLVVKLSRKDGEIIKKSFMDCVDDIIASKDVDLMIIKLCDIEDNLIMGKGDTNVPGWDWEDALRRYTEGKIKLICALDDMCFVIDSK